MTNEQVTKHGQHIASQLVNFLKKSLANNDANKVIDYNLLNKAVDHLVSVANLAASMQTPDTRFEEGW